jgi:oxygen-independent coproporphyrinogen-3 oxidase
MYEWASETFEANRYLQYEISNWAKSIAEDRMQKAENSSSSLLHSTFQCRHNLQYWRCLPYLAFGAGAHGYADGYRYSNVLRIKTFIERITDYELRSTQYEFPLTPATVNQHRQTLHDDMAEFMMTGLRLTQEGVSFHEFEQRFGRSLYDEYGKEIENLSKIGLVEQLDSPLPIITRADRRCGARSDSEVEAGLRVRLTPRGRLLGNQVFMRFV